MSTGHEYDYCLFYKPSGDSSFLICSAPSMIEIKNAARKDSKENGRAPERYTYQYTTSGLLFNREEVRQCDIYNLL